MRTKNASTKALFFFIIGLSVIEGKAVSAQTTHVLITDPRVLAIKVQDNHEPMVDVRKAGRICIGPSPEVPDNIDYYYMRRTVYEKLLMAQKQLPVDMKFCLYEGYRSLSLQKNLFENRLSKVKQLHPHWTFDQQFIETTRLVSPVINLDGSPNIPPHATGAAIDVYLIDIHNQALDMGLALKDWIKDDDGSLSQSDAAKISKTAQQYRAIMSQALLAAGFVNYPTEYWHWSYGDRYWAYVSKAPHAIYDIV